MAAIGANGNFYSRFSQRDTGLALVAPGDYNGDAVGARGDRESDWDTSGAIVPRILYNPSGRCHALALTSTFLEAALASGFLGSVIVSTPLAKSAEILSRSIPSGSTRLRLNDPYSRSDRW